MRGCCILTQSNLVQRMVLKNTPNYRPTFRNMNRITANIRICKDALGGLILNTQVYEYGAPRSRKILGLFVWGFFWLVFSPSGCNFCTLSLLFSLHVCHHVLFVELHCGKCTCIINSVIGVSP